MTTVAIIQARISSKRLPGKALAYLDKRPVLLWVVEAARRAYGIDRVIVATPDRVIEELCSRELIDAVRGPEVDVLARFEKAARKTGAEVVVRLTADCPFLDSNVISDVVRFRRGWSTHYTMNRGYPDGLDVECFTAEALFEAAKNATTEYDREHVTPYIKRQQPPWVPVNCPLGDLSRDRWTLDTEADFEFCRAVAKCLDGETPTYQRILHILDRERAITQAV